jgi:hypothetical protein
MVDTKKMSSPMGACTVVSLCLSLTWTVTRKAVDCTAPFVVNMNKQLLIVCVVALCLCASVSAMGGKRINEFKRLRTKSHGGHGPKPILPASMDVRTLDWGNVDGKSYVTKSVNHPGGEIPYATPYTNGCAAPTPGRRESRSAPRRRQKGCSAAPPGSSKTRPPLAWMLAERGMSIPMEVASVHMPMRECYA